MVCTKLVAAFPLRWPSSGSLRRAHDTTLRRFFRERRSAHPQVVGLRVERIKPSAPLATDRAVITAPVVWCRNNPLPVDLKSD